MEYNFKEIEPKWQRRWQDVEAFLAFVARVDVRGDIAQRMAYVQAGARRVGEHVEHVEFQGDRAQVAAPLEGK